MPILVVHHPEERYIARLVVAALVRSFSMAQVAIATYEDVAALPEASVLINPRGHATALVRESQWAGRKVLLLGEMSVELAGEVGLRCRSGECLDEKDALAEMNEAAPASMSPLAVRYADDHFLAGASPLRQRHLARFDFGNEWNNLGYGRITLDRGPWSLAMVAEADGATPVAWLERHGQALPLLYAAIRDRRDSSMLWFNRSVGPLDSLEWRLVELFFGEYRPDELPCFPYLAEIPAGYQAAVTMRLDCDEAIASASELFHLYASRHVPLSLAVKTELPIRPPDRGLLREVLACRGSVVSHSVRHLREWGGSYPAALAEASRSRAWLEDALPQCRPVCYAVSPFHQNPPYAVQALADAGYHGFVGGIIANDPEFLLGRAGRVPLIEPAVVSHSQQCMLHGDCYHRAGDSSEVYRQSFDNHRQARAMFGYVDHPFSRRYQYGWRSENERVTVHQELLDHIDAQPDTWRASLAECFGFLRKRDAARIWREPDGTVAIRCVGQDELPPLGICWKGRTQAA